MGKRVTGYDNIYVILRTDKRFEEGYKIVERDFPNAEYIYQPSSKKEAHASFKKMALDVLYNDERELSDYFLFAMDDIIVIDDIDLNQGKRVLEEHPEVHCFFYRLGKNVTKYYTPPGNGFMKLPPLKKIEEDVFTWDFAKGEVEWRYPNNLDFTIYRKKTMKKACHLAIYHDPNSFEGAWQRFLPKNSKGACHGWSKIVNIPMNRVNTTFKNRFLNTFSIDDLNTLFMEGKKIDIDSLDKSLVNSPHQDVPFSFMVRG